MTRCERDPAGTIPGTRLTSDSNELRGRDVVDLKDIVDIDAIQAMMDDFFRLTKIGVAIVDLKGNVLVATGWQDICTQFHRRHP